MKIGAKSSGKPAAGSNNEHGCEVNVSFSLISLFVSPAPFNFLFLFLLSFQHQAVPFKTLVLSFL